MRRAIVKPTARLFIGLRHRHQMMGRRRWIWRMRMCGRRFITTFGQHPGRPFVIAAHSQGSVLAYRLLREEIAGKPLRIQLVAAYLIGATLTVEGVHKSLPDVPICATPEQTGCVIGWNARGPHNQPGDFEMTLPLDPAPVPPSPAGCPPPASACV
jgi:hypothetical protein